MGRATLWAERRTYLITSSQEVVSRVKRYVQRGGCGAISEDVELQKKKNTQQKKRNEHTKETVYQEGVFK